MVKTATRSTPKYVTLKTLERWEFGIEQIASIWYDDLPAIVRYRLLLIAHSMERVRQAMLQAQSKAHRKH